jgi:hypothetical protein
VRCDELLQKVQMRMRCKKVSHYYPCYYLPKKWRRWKELTTRTTHLVKSVLEQSLPVFAQIK